MRYLSTTGCDITFRFPVANQRGVTISRADLIAREFDPYRVGLALTGKLKFSHVPEVFVAHNSRFMS